MAALLLFSLVLTSCAEEFDDGFGGDGATNTDPAGDDQHNAQTDDQTDNLVNNSSTSPNSSTPSGAANSGGLPSSEFVTVDPDAPRFLLEGRPFYFAGTNLYWLPQQQSYGAAAVDDAFDVAQDVGLTVIRVWGFADGSEWTQSNDPAIVQPRPGVYNESALEALDQVISEAAARGLKVIIPLVNYWQDFGGMLQYARWAGGRDYAFFYTSTEAKELYKAYASMLLTRQNSVTGVAYRDDPTILSWELANEANAGFDAGFDGGPGRGVLADWYAEMAEHVKSVDPNHLVSTGEEGYAVERHRDRYASDYTNTYVLRGESGTSFVENSSLDDIDFAGAHLYPDAWGFADAENDGLRWITDHAEIAHQLGKPLVIGEFGSGDRAVYAGWLDQIESSDVAGSLVWELVPASRGRGSEMVVVHPDDAELVDLFRDHARTMSQKR